MDEKPFLELDMLDIDEYSVPELAKLTKSDFDVDSILNAAEELKYVSQIKKVISTQFTEPEDDFIKFIAGKVYDGMVTQKVRELFSVLTRKATAQYLNDQVNDRLKSAMSGISSKVLPAAILEEEEPAVEEDASEKDANKILTTQEEIEGFHIVKAIIRSSVDVKRIVMRDTQSYCGILLDDNNRKPICRLHFNRNQKYIGIFDEEKNERRCPINSVDDIYDYTEELKETVMLYD